LKISGNKILKKTFGPIVKQVTRKWILYSVPNYITVVKWKRLRWGHIIHTDLWLEIPWNETTSVPEDD